MTHFKKKSTRIEILRFTYKKQGKKYYKEEEQLFS